MVFLNDQPQPYALVSPEWVRAATIGAPAINAPSHAVFYSFLPSSVLLIKHGLPLEWHL